MEQKTNNELYELMESTQVMVGILLRNKLSDKLSKVEDEVKRKERMSTKQIMKFVNVTRPTALGYMEKLAEMPGFFYRKGESAKKTSGILVYEKSKVYGMRLQRLANKFEKATVVPFHEIMVDFGFTLSETKDFVDIVCNNTKKYRIKDENKLEKII